MNTYKCEEVLTKKKIIDLLLGSFGYCKKVTETIYNNYQVGDKVVFKHTEFNGKKLTGTIRSKKSYPRQMYRNKTTVIEYNFLIELTARVDLILED